MARSLTGPQALYLSHLAEQVQAGGARPDFQLNVEWGEGRQRIYAEVSINALTLRGGVVERVESHISLLEVNGARSPPSPTHINRAEAVLRRLTAQHVLDIADGELTYLLNGGGDPDRVLLILRVPSHWYRALHTARQLLLNGIQLVPDGQVKPRKEFHLSLDGTADWTMCQALERWHQYQWLERWHLERWQRIPS